MKNKQVRTFPKWLLTGFLFFSIPMASFAETTTMNVGINASSALTLSLPSSIPLGNVEMTSGGIQHTKGFTQKLRVEDYRGTGEGWILTAEATMVKEIGGKGLILPSDALIMYRPLNFTTTGGSTLGPTPGPAEQGYISQAPLTLAVAPSNKGMGDWEANFPSLELYVDPWIVVVDKEHYPTQPTPYSATITFSLVTGP